MAVKTNLIKLWHNHVVKQLIVMVFQLSLILFTKWKSLVTVAVSPKMCSFPQT